MIGPGFKSKASLEATGGRSGYIERFHLGRATRLLVRLFVDR